MGTILLHGYPGTFVDFEKLIGPLTDPASHGGDAGDAFHLFIPSLPGRPLDPARGSGWEMTRTTSAFVELMRRVGYERCVAHDQIVGDFSSERAQVIFRRLEEKGLIAGPERIEQRAEELAQQRLEALKQEHGIPA
jgi:hypothetical protein